MSDLKKIDMPSPPNRYSIEWAGNTAHFCLDNDPIFSIGPISGEVATSIANKLNGAYKMGYIYGFMNSKKEE